MLAFADAIIVLDEGRVVDQGSYEELKVRMPEIMASIYMSEDDNTVSMEATLVDSKSAGLAAETANSEVIDLRRQQGSWSVYSYYFRSAGYIPLIFSMSCVLVECFSANFSSKCPYFIKWRQLRIKSDILVSNMDLKVGWLKRKRAESTSCFLSRNLRVDIFHVVPRSFDWMLVRYLFCPYLKR